MKDSDKDRFVEAHIYLRRLMGLVAMSLPVFLPIAAIVCGDETALRTSVSAYYHSSVGNEFVGALVTVGVFLFAYKGYDYWDDWLSNLGGLAALGVALCPLDPPGMTESSAVQYSHYISGAGLFLVLFVFAVFVFTKTAKCEETTREKLQRNCLYRICGLVIAAGLIACFGWMVFADNDSIPFVFVAEFLMLEAFGLAWLVKGKAVLRDSLE